MQKAIVYFSFLLFLCQYQIDCVFSEICPLHVDKIKQRQTEVLKEEINSLQTIHGTLGAGCESSSGDLCFLVHDHLHKAFEESIQLLQVQANELEVAKTMWQVFQIGSIGLSVLSGLLGKVYVSVPLGAVASNFNGKRINCKSAKHEIHLMNARLSTLMAYLKNLSRGFKTLRISNLESPCSPYEIGDAIHTCSNLNRKYAQLRKYENDISRIIFLRKQGAPKEEIQLFIWDATIGVTMGSILSSLSFLYSNFHTDLGQSLVNELVSQVTDLGIERSREFFQLDAKKCFQHLTEYKTIHVLKAKLSVLLVVSNTLAHLLQEECNNLTVEQSSAPKSPRRP